MPQAHILHSSTFNSSLRLPLFVWHPLLRCGVSPSGSDPLTAVCQVSSFFVRRQFRPERVRCDDLVQDGETTLLR